MRAHTIVVASAVMLLAAPSCSPNAADPRASEPTSGAEKASVFVVNYPLKYFAERIAGGTLEVEFPAPPAVDPAYWVPETSTIVEYQRAGVILLNGASYAKWTDKVALPEAKLVDTSASFNDQYIKVQESTTHSHGPEGEHAHWGVAFTTWLDPTLAVKQAGTIAEELSRRWPEHAESFRARYRDLEKELLELDRRIAQTVARSPETPLFFSHPVYQYFIRRYDLRGRSLHWEPDEAPSAAMWSELEAIRKQHPAAWMVWEGEPSPETASKLAEKGVRSLVFDPCGNVPGREDYLTVMRRNASALELAFPRE